MLDGAAAGPHAASSEFSRFEIVRDLGSTMVAIRLI